MKCRKYQGKIMPLHEESDFAVLPVLIPLEEGMAVKSLDGAVEPEVPPVVHPYLSASPNPFNPVTKIRFGLTQAGEVRLNIYDIRGAWIASLVNGFMEAGHHVVPWAGHDSSGREVGSGLYFARMVAGPVSFNQKIMLVK